MSDMTNKTGICGECSKKMIMTPGVWNKKYCSNHCSGKAYRRITGFGFSYGLATGTVGAIAELMVSIDLMKKGYEVFRALSQACSCDVLAKKDGKIYSFEVRTGHPTSKGYSYPKNNIRAENIALVIHRDNKIVYIPENFISSGNVS